MGAERSFKKNHFLNEVKWFKCGEEILDYLESEENIIDKQHIILLDLNMPGIDGYEVLKRVKSSSKLKLIPIVVLTTSNDERDVEECYRLGASTFITKPVSFEGLATAIAVMKEYWFGFALIPRVKE